MKAADGTHLQNVRKHLPIDITSHPISQSYKMLLIAFNKHAKKAEIIP
jgi:hypothetical protein